jgi:predicted PurR-regulated permease PerM
MSRVMPRGLATVLVLLAVLGLAAGATAIVVPALVDQASEAVQKAPDALQRVKRWMNRTAREAKAPKPQEVAKKVEEHATNALGDLLKGLVPAALGAVELASTAILLLVLAAFLVAAPDSYRDALRTLVPREYEPNYDETWKRVATGLRHWVGGILVSMTLMGALTALGLALAGIKAWPLLGLLTFFGTFVPYLGAISSAVPGLIVGLADSPLKFVAAAGVYLGVHIVEGYLVQPFVMKRAVEIRPATLLFGQAAAGMLFGVLGTVVATPAIVCLKAAVGYLYVERRLGKEGPQP